MSVEERGGHWAHVFVLRGGGWVGVGGYVLLMRVEFPCRAIKQIFRGVGGGD